MDEPLADPAAVALNFACEEAAKHVKVALSGEGADEFFGGYNIYREPLDIKILTVLPMPIRRLLGGIASAIPFNIKGKNFFIRGSKTVEERFIGGANIFSKHEREQLLLNDKGAAPQELCAPIYKTAQDQDDITKMQLLDIQMWMVGDIFQKADKMSKLHGLELRSPLVDKEVFRVASRIPTALRVNKGGTKYAFRRSAAKHLPESWARRKKLGFPIPIRIWLREEKYYNIVLSHFTGEAAQKYFNTDALTKLLEDHRREKADNSRKIWTVFMFLLWHKEYFEGNHDSKQDSEQDIKQDGE
jgi:asparagine synthase (glutamine-hydrolysing)